MSVEAIASAWARSEQAPDGAVVVLESEVSGRLRGGLPWTLGAGRGLMLAMVVRPDIDPLQEALLWLPASLAASDALTAITNVPHVVLWPDRVAARHPQVRDETARCAVSVLVQLGPGRVEHSVFATRIDLQGLTESEREGVTADSFIPHYVESVRRHLKLLETDLDALLSEYSDRCAHMGERVRAELLPRGEARGQVAAVDRDGFLVLESPTGMLERIAPAGLRSIEIVR